MTIFGGKSGSGPKAFSYNDLMDHVDLLLKLAKEAERNRSAHNYSWLRSKSFDENDALAIHQEVAKVKPLLNKLTSESSAAIAVKLDSYADEIPNVTTDNILDALKAFVNEELNLKLIEKSVKDMKRNKSFKNRVRPELVGREATVSFILDEESLYE